MTDNERELLQAIASAESTIKNCIGVIQEYVAMPCDSLQTRMEKQSRRAEYEVKELQGILIKYQVEI